MQKSSMQYIITLRIKFPLEIPLVFIIFAVLILLQFNIFTIHMQKGS